MSAVPAAFVLRTRRVAAVTHTGAVREIASACSGTVVRERICAEGERSCC